MNVFHLKQFAYFLERMRQTPDGDGSLLDHTLMLYGSGMSDSNMHLPYNVPTMVVGGSLFDIKGGRHIQATDSTPLTNLQLTLMERMGARMERFGDSTGELSLLTGASVASHCATLPRIEPVVISFPSDAFRV